MKPSLAVERLTGETLATLTVRGRGVELEQICIWAGISSYGTSKDKAVRLLAWYANQTKKLSAFEVLEKVELAFKQESYVIVTYKERCNISEISKVQGQLRWIQDEKECFEVLTPDNYSEMIEIDEVISIDF